MNAVVDASDAPSFAVTFSGSGGLSVSKALSLTAVEWTELLVSYGTYQFILPGDLDAIVCLCLGSSSSTTPLTMNHVQGKAQDVFLFDMESKNDDYWPFFSAKQVAFRRHADLVEALVNNDDLRLTVRNLCENHDVHQCSLLDLHFTVTLYFKL